MEERITDLESRVAFQGQTVHDLDEEVRLIAKRLERLERRVAGLADQLRAGDAEIGPADEKPPHY